MTVSNNTNITSQTTNNTTQTTTKNKTFEDMLADTSVSTKEQDT